MKVLKPGYYSLTRDGNRWIITPEDGADSIYISPKNGSEIHNIFGVNFICELMLDESKAEYRLKLDSPYTLIRCK
jgi:hypothetical protein